MIAYTLRRLLILPLTLFGMTIIIFLMLLILGPETRAAYYLQDIPKNDAVLEGIIRRYRLRDPIPIQYWHWLVGRADSETGEIQGGILRGNLGYSRFGGRPVSELVRLRFPATFELALFSLIPTIILGVWLGVLTAVHQNRSIDHLARVVSILGYSLPGFILGILLLVGFYSKLHWFPAGRISDWVALEVLNGSFPVHTGMFTVDAVWNGRVDVFWDAIRHLVLPAVTLAVISVAAFLRITRASMLESLKQEYIVTARAKGLPERLVVSRHALANALLPVTTYSGMIVAASLSGAVIVETIFNFQGMGYAAAKSAAEFDVVAVLGYTMITACLLIFVNLAVDILYGVLDPRIRLG